MTRLDGNDGGPDLDALGHLAGERDRRHGVEVTGDLWDPDGDETGAVGRLYVRDQPCQPVRAVAHLVGADHQSEPHLVSPSREAAGRVTIYSPAHTQSTGCRRGSGGATWVGPRWLRAVHPALASRSAGTSQGVRTGSGCSISTAGRRSGPPRV